MNHLCPVIRYSAPGPPLPVASAVVVLVRTSVPPCFSVMPMPMVTPRLAPAGLKALSYSRARIFGTHPLASSGCSSSAGTAALVMVIGHWCPASIWIAM
jgi:hypothetical protein